MRKTLETLLSVRQLAERWGFSKGWVRARLKNGEISHFKLNGDIRISEGAALQFLEQHRSFKKTTKPASEFVRLIEGAHRERGN